MYHQGLKVPKWKVAMDLDYRTLVYRDTWDLVACLTDANITTCKWVFTLKYHPYDTVTRHKAWLAAKRFSQAHDIDYTETFS